jgi:hypothetical protein
MSTRQLQIHAYREWTRAPDLKRQYHTFDYYWMERYARVYCLPTRIRPVERPLH